MGSQRPQVLVLSFSDISRDARVLRQVAGVARRAEVTTAGFGPQPAGASAHVQLPGGLSSLPSQGLGLAALAAHRWSVADTAAPAVRAALELVPRGRWDAVVANEVRAVPAALALAGAAPVWADLHEWAPQERTQVLAWRLLVAPWIRSLCERLLPLCRATTTVSDPIAALYRERYGIAPRVVRNAPPRQDLRPVPCAGGPLRLVHAGSAVPGRNLEALVDVVELLAGAAELDFLLVPGGDGGRYLRQVQHRAARVPGVSFRDPVAPADIPRAINGYDVGVYSIPPVNPNTALALPNKFFDFVQARLAIAIGPSPSMAELVREHGMGGVAADYSAAALADVLRPMTSADVDRSKRGTHAAADVLCAEADEPALDAVLDALLAAAPAGGSR